MEILEQFILISTIFKLINVVIVFSLAWLIHRLSWRIAGLFLRGKDFGLASRLTSQHDDLAHDVAPTEPYNNSHQYGTGNSSRRNRAIMAKVSKQLMVLDKWLPAEFKTPRQLRRERKQTLQELVANAISVVVFLTAILVSFSQFAGPETVIWVTGLFGTALAFAGRTFIGDYLAGLVIIFQDKFAVGDKIQIKAQMEIIEGVVEHVSLNATWLRAATGELYIISNGEMRFICNFSRGLYSSANITVSIPATDLEKSLQLLQDLSQEAVNLLPELKEPWKVISETGTLGQNVELTMVAMAHFGQAAVLRPRLLTLVQERLAQADIILAKG
jgi:small conductance mechanosensitive channel